MNILLVEDEPDVSKSLTVFLQKLGHAVSWASDGASGLRRFHEHPFQMVITDIRMPAMSGLELLRRIKVIESSPVDVIVITGHGDMENAITALKYGAFDYLQKPINVKELAITIDRADEYASLRSKYIKLKNEFDERIEAEIDSIRGEAQQLRKAYMQEIGLDELCVYSDAMKGVVHQAEKYSKDRTIPVLIEGESGTGKELIARHIHYFGNEDPLSPFVAINCGALSQDLFQSELFGHEPGAFTGATRTGRPGIIEAASGGTVFLDEIGELPLQLQVKLLRVIEGKRLYRLGGLQEIPVDVRFICASNKDLKKAVYENQFRLDLYYRINMGYIYIPPLRERKEAILPLASRFVRRAYIRKGKHFEKFTNDAEQFMLDFSWPGNVRQLKNAIERLALMKADGRIDKGDLATGCDFDSLEERGRRDCFVLGHDDFDLPPTKLELDRMNAKIIRLALKKFRGNQTRTADYLGISRRALQGRLKKLEIE